MRKLIGFIPSSLNVATFGIPIYKNSEDNCFEYHKLDERAKIIIAFEKIPQEPLQMVELPEYLEKTCIEIDDAAFFVINAVSILFVGTIDDLRPYLDGIKNVAGENFMKELESIL